MYQAELLRGQTILITGGGTGLGRSMALRFAELGANLSSPLAGKSRCETRLRRFAGAGARPPGPPATCATSPPWMRWSKKRRKNSAAWMCW